MCVLCMYTVYVCVVRVYCVCVMCVCEKSLQGPKLAVASKIYRLWFKEPLGGCLVCVAPARL